MDFINAKTAARRWNLTERRVTMLCRNGRIEGVQKEKGIWMISADAPKPADGRTNKAASIINAKKKLPLPIGVSDFKNLVSNYYYVDKTLLIKDFLDTKAKVTLFIRPRRFGKTLNMDMLKTFFEISEEDTSAYFRRMNIWTRGEEYRQKQGKYPVIFVSFKDVKAKTWVNTLEGIRDIIAQEYRRHKYFLDDSQFDEYEKKYFRSILDGTVSEVGLAASFRNLSSMLNLHYKQPTIIIVDEYDTPIQQGYMADYYSNVVELMRNLFSGAFKDNRNLA